VRRGTGAFRILRPGALLALAGLLLLLPAACTTAPPSGPLFRPQSPPAGDRALVYLYRRDSLRGVGAVDIELDGESLGRLGDGQYMALILPAAPHRLSLRLKRFRFLPTSWTHLPIELAAGSTSYLHIWAGYEELDMGPESRSLEVPGRANRQASVGIFAVRRNRSDAQGDLSASHQVKVVRHGSIR
jgi:hypothetical protein